MIADERCPHCKAHGTATGPPQIDTKRPRLVIRYCCPNGHRYSVHVPLDGYDVKGFVGTG
jgi:hypothetical protein